jgi:hypothetical protein
LTNNTWEGETAKYENGDVLMMEVNMDASPHTLHFFRNGEQQLPYFSNIPDSINFVVLLHSSLFFLQFHLNSEVTLLGDEGCILEWMKRIPIASSVSQEKEKKVELPLISPAERAKRREQQSKETLLLKKQFPTPSLTCSFLFFFPLFSNS